MTKEKNIFLFGRKNWPESFCQMCFGPFPSGSNASMHLTFSPLTLAPPRNNQIKMLKSAVPSPLIL